MKRLIVFATILAGGGWDCYAVEGTADRIVWNTGDTRFPAAIVPGNALDD